MIAYQKVSFYTLGCKLNFAETSTIARQFIDAGYARVDLEQCPDVVIINTCSVTDQADKKCRNIVRRSLKINPEAFIVVIGCYAQLKPDEIAAITGVDIVLGANEKFNVLQFLEDKKRESGISISTEIKQTKEFIPSFSSGDRTRTFLKVQDGCNYFCAFCTIPLARGRSRSASIEDTLSQAQLAINEGAKEIVLTGVNIGDFGHTGDENLLGLIKQLDKLSGVERFRISSIEPNLLSNEIIQFVAQSDKFVPHFHIPLQSGSDAVLQKMRRRYRTDLYRERISEIKKLLPDSCIGIDVIVGFPGETDEEFENTFNYLQELEFSYLHVFTYSERDNTTALRIDEVVPMDLRHQRNKRLRILSEKKKRAFYESQLNKTRPVLIEADENEGVMSGFTDNYVKVVIPYNPQLVNTVTEMELKEINGDGIMNAVICDKSLA